MAITSFQLSSSGSQEIVIGSGFNVDATDFIIQLEASSSWTGSVEVKKTVYGAVSPFTSSYTRLSTNAVASSSFARAAAPTGSVLSGSLNEGIKVDGSGCTVILQHNRVAGTLVITTSQVRSTGRAG